MRKYFLLTLSCLFLLSSPASAEVEVVPHVDLTRYIGKWFEIAAIPQSFQRNCIANVTAEYAILNNQRIRVLNSCDQNDGSRKVAEGRAKVVDSSTNAKLKVTFVKIIDWIFIFGGDYWIIDLETNYRYAVVGHPTRKYGWILARDPALPIQELQVIAERLKGQGYNTCDFITTKQLGGISEKIPLCDYLKK